MSLGIGGLTLPGKVLLSAPHNKKHSSPLTGTPEASMYEAWFGFADLPFSIAPDPRFYVDTAAHRAAIRAVQDRLGRGDEFVPIIGDFGSGKTTVGRRIVQEIDRASQVAGELPSMHVEGDHLFDRVAEALGLRPAGGLPPLANVIQQLEGLVRNGREALLLVDDAHLMDMSVLRRLRKLTAVRVDGRAALRVCLVGHSTPGFEELQRFNHPLSVAEPVEVAALDAAGTHAYILGRLQCAGWNGRPAFDGATAAIHACCEGQPARINRLCGHILLHLYLRKRDDVNDAVVRAVDELLQAELRGESATLVLPPVAPATPASPMPASPAIDTRAVPNGEARVARLVAKASQSMRPKDARIAAPRAYGAMPRRRGLAQGVTTVALMVTGAFLWQMISNFATARPEWTRQALETTATVASTPPAAPLQATRPGPTQVAADKSTSPAPAAAGLAAMAEEIIERSPPAASAPAGRVPSKE